MNIKTVLILERLKKLEKKIDWYYLSYNNNINYEIYSKYQDKPWSLFVLLNKNTLTINEINLLPNTDLTWKYVSMCNSLTIDFILNHLDKPLNWESISCNDVITIDDIESNLDLPWKWNMISINKNINIDFIKRHLDKPWNISLLSCNNSLSFEDIYNNIDLFDWNWRDITDNHNIRLTIEQINILKDKKLNWYSISKKIINLDIVLNNIDLPWDWSGLSMNENISLNEILYHSELPWDWDYIIGSHPHVSINFIKEHYNKAKNLFYYYIITNKNLTFEDICDLANNTNIFKKCSYSIWKYVIENPNVKFINVVENLDKDWDWRMISLSNNITYLDIINNLDLPWYWPFISQNNSIFNIKYTDPDYLEYTKKLLSINKIKRRWFECITNPNYKLCKKRLLSEFNKLDNINYYEDDLDSGSPQR